MRVLLTGASSFVGGYLVPLFESSGMEVCSLVRRRTGRMNEFVWDFVGALPPDLPSCEVVVHLAAYVYFGRELEVAQYQVNTVSTIKLVAYARAHASRLIYASMAGVHGSGHAVIDEDTPVVPGSHYGVSKYLSEEVIDAFLDEYRILRICGIYGLNGPAHLGLNVAIDNAVHRGLPPVLKGPGQGKRNYICVVDVARWIAALAAGRWLGGGVGGRVLYLAGPEVLTVEDYLRILTDRILPGRDFGRADGPDCADSVVHASPAPFALMTFDEYLASLSSMGGSAVKSSFEGVRK